MATTKLGIAVNFGTSVTAVTGSGIGTFTLQSYDHARSRDVDTVRDEAGTEVQATLYNETQMATFEYIPSSSANSTLAAATIIPDPGTIVTVTNASNYTPIAATTWFVWETPKISFTNTGVARVSLTLKRWLGSGGITAVTT